MKTTSTVTDAELLLRASLSDEQVTELMADDMLPEYDIDYNQARPNRFARRETAAKTVLLPLIQAMPQIAYREMPSA